MQNEPNDEEVREQCNVIDYRTQFDDINLITEEVNGEKQYHIDGIFMQAEQKNRNGRVYPNKVLMNEVQKYNNEYVKRAEQWENSDTQRVHNSTLSESLT